jgi:hypothetical protein
MSSKFLLIFSYDSSQRSTNYFVSTSIALIDRYSSFFGAKPVKSEEPKVEVVDSTKKRKTDEHIEISPKEEQGNSNKCFLTNSCDSKEAVEKDQIGRSKRVDR